MLFGSETVGRVGSNRCPTQPMDGSTYSTCAEDRAVINIAAHAISVKTTPCLATAKLVFVSATVQSRLPDSMFQPSVVTRTSLSELRVSIRTVFDSPGSNEK